MSGFQGRRFGRELFLVGLVLSTVHPLRLPRVSLATLALAHMHVLIDDRGAPADSLIFNAHVAEVPARGVRGPMPADPETKGRRQPGVSFTRGVSHPQAQSEHFSFLLSLRSAGASVSAVQTLCLSENKHLAVSPQASCTYQRRQGCRDVSDVASRRCEDIPSCQHSMPTTRTHMAPSSTRADPDVVFFQGLCSLVQKQPFCFRRTSPNKHVNLLPPRATPSTFPP